MTTKYGVFQEPGYLNTGIPYKGAQAKNDAATLLNFKAPACKMGKNNDACFDKFKPLLEGDRYIDPARQTMQQATLNRSKNVTDRPFKCISPMKASSGTGDFFGTLGGRVEYHTPLVQTRLQKGDAQSEPPRMYTNPPKRGGFGVPKTTISERAGPGGVLGEYKWAAEPYNRPRELARLDAEAAKKLKHTELPFKPSSPGKHGTFGVPATTLSRKAKGAVGEYEYSMLGPAPRTAGGDPRITVPFRPTHPNKAGHQGSLARFPEYIADPEKAKQEAERQRLKQEAARLASTNPWRPNMAGKTDMTRSVVRMNITR